MSLAKLNERGRRVSYLVLVAAKLALHLCS